MLKSWIKATHGRHDLAVMGINLAFSAFCSAVTLGVLAILTVRNLGEVSVLALVGCGFAFLASSSAVATLIYGRHQMGQRLATYVEMRNSRKATDELFTMTDMLQSAEGYDDATAVLKATSLRLLPDYGVALYIFNNSRDRLDLAGNWNMPGDHRAAEVLAPSNCWALKRGKPHINDPATGTLCCAHHTDSIAMLELPMLARGQVYGLLMFVTDREQAFDALIGIRRQCRALADSMSLALSNIALREKLRTQSLRDPLTGLYNRRYMEDALERYVNLAERSGGVTSALMIDLDNFKRLNDEHGHAKGDAVLRDVASQLVGGLRPADVVCRYGGEELLVILPNCNLDDAAMKAEVLRARVAGLSEVHGAAVSASFGVASIPETANAPADLIALADAALYKAKAAGRNCVICADRRTAKDDPQLRLAVTR